MQETPNHASEAFPDRAQRESAQRYHLITELMPVMVWMSGTDKLCFYFNKSWLDFVGRTLEQEQGNGWVENVHPDDLDRCVQIYVNCFDARREFKMEYRLRHHTGQYRWILDQGVPRFAPDGSFEGYVGGCLDIHDQKEAAEARQRLGAIVESSNDAIISKNLQGIITSWNPAAEMMFGYTPQEIIGRPVLTIIPPEMHGDEQKILDTIARGQRIEHFETVRMTKSGKRIDVSLTVSPVKDEHGNIIGAAKIARDITQQKKALLALRNAERLAAVGRLAATVAHEINNPLEAVTNYIYLARRNAVRDDVAGYLRDAEEQLERVAHLARQTLGFYRDTKAPGSLRVGELLQPLVAVFAPRARNKGIEIREEVLRDEEVYAVAGEIRQLIANLLSNSLDAAPQRGTIRLRISSVHDQSGRRSLRITVGDNGPGIPPSVRERLFEPFFTTKKDIGTGLGLWVCKNIVENHHGSIRVKSSTTPGNSWTVFSVLLPASQPAALKQAG